MADNGVDNVGFELDEIKSPKNGHAVLTTKDEEAKVDNTTPFKKSRFSCFFSPQVFTVFLVIWSIAKASAGGYASGTLTTFERRFQLRSTQIGYFSVVEDVVGLTTVMFIVHYGQSSHRPRVIGLLALIVAVGVAVQGLPHFLYKLPVQFRTPMMANVNASGNDTQPARLICDPGTGEPETCTAEEEDRAGSLIHEAWWFPLGSAISSLGGGIAPIAITYLDDNVTRRSMPVYISIIISVFAFGAVFGFLLSGFTLRLPVTWPVQDPSYYSAVSEDFNFLGAWWLGYFILSAILAILGLLMCAFPRQMRDPEELARENEEYLRSHPIPESAKAKVKREKSGEGNFDSYNGVIEFLKDFLISLSQIVRNVIVMCITLSGCFVAFTSTIFLIFGPKFLSTVYGLNAGFAAFAMAAFLIPGAFLGQIIGGILIRGLKLTRYGLAALGTLTDIILLVGVAFFYIIRCEPREIAGLQDTFYPGNSEVGSFAAPCNVDCGCSEGSYAPVCGSDGVTYVSACHAGCDYKDGRNYSDCSCFVNQTAEILGNATMGECDKPCEAWYYFIAVLIPTSFIGTLGATAGFMLQIRSVDDAHRGLALSFGNVLIRLIGYIPGPLVIGAVIDKSCIFFQSSCGEIGNCNVYDALNFQNGFITTMVVATLLSTVFIIISYIYVRQTTPKGERVWRQKTLEVCLALAVSEGVSAEPRREREVSTVSDYA